VAAAITARSATGTVVNKLTFAHISVTGVDDNDSDGLEKRYYLQATLAGQDTLRSHVFGPSSDGKHTWDNVMFPVAGAWSVTLRGVEDDSTVATLALTVA
jgi:hypothetical protein